jgi:hypothetical protein
MAPNMYASFGLCKGSVRSPDKTKRISSKLRPAGDWEILNFTKLIQHYKMH